MFSMALKWMYMGVQYFRGDTLIAKQDGLLFTLAVDEYFNALLPGYKLLKFILIWRILSLKVSKAHPQPGSF